MQKIIISLLLFVTTLPVFASWPQAGRYKKLPLLEVERTVAQYTHTQAWQKQLARLKELYKKSDGNAPSGAPLVSNDVLGPKAQQTYLKRIMQLCASIRGNSHLKEFSFVAPSATDLADLSLDNYAVLHAFLKGLPFAQVTATELVRPFTLAVRLKGQPAGAAEIWIDLPTHNVYLMSNNLYTTAAGKYGLHLR